MTVGEKIEEVMTWRGKSQQALERLSGVSQSLISDYINNRRSPPVDKLKMIANALNVSLWVFLNDEALMADSLDLTKQESLVVTEFRRLKQDQQTKIFELMQTM